ncbi:ABC-2 type transport system ATP-binding protein [Bacillus pakistanensis]|uniref:ABC-2 type transport system ATP-binding protein n=1 Tax=Rossellomorea pakistanensis TaxID=992288 RepID=A0ABS2NJL6_9BACI|nr:ABC transporter ATP-binding protein [Bacillus pakistanensis]MBM7588058.1 ABC-2 type transport system ATP-binding protein [Bacillus pakistanensis]
MNDYAIKLGNVTKEYNGFYAVRGMNLQISKGEIFGFLGPNGAGKTTTIKMLTGLEEPTKGNVYILGINVQENPIEAKKKIAYIPDKVNIYGKLTGWEFLRFMASVFHIDEGVFEEKANHYLSLLEIEHRADDYIENYSHGMKQKITLCGALIHDPEIIILDEPTVGLDPKSTRTLKDILTNLSKEGKTIFLSSHILEIVEQMCTSVAIVQDGRLITTGTMEEIRNKAEKADDSLEDIFLRLTGERTDVIHAVQALKGEDRK